MTAHKSVDPLYPAHLSTVLAAVAQASQNVGASDLVIHSGHQHPVFLDDTTYPFRANPWAQWLVPGAVAPDSLILIRNNHKPALVFVAPQDYWHAPPAPLGGLWTQHFDIQTVPTAAQALAVLPRLDRQTVWIGETAPPDGRWMHNPTQLLARLEQARVLKTPYEIACLRQATASGAAGHRAAERAFRDGASEFEIHLAFLRATSQNETELPYGSIVALNTHAATLHYQLRDRIPPQQQHSLLIDAGAAWRGYASDITRTWSARTGLFSALVDGMHQLQQALCAAIRPGVDWRDLHLEAHHAVATLLHESGVLRVTGEEAVVRGISGRFLPHGLGHLLGLQVHDVGGFQDSADSAPIARPDGHPALRLTRKLLAGMVVTVEPGLYFIDSLLDPLRSGPDAAAIDWQAVDTLRPCGGIRIEDDVVVTADGHDNLTRAAFAAHA